MRLKNVISRRDFLRSIESEMFDFGFIRFPNQFKVLTQNDERRLGFKKLILIRCMKYEVVIGVSTNTP